jgi:hypothetical protein
VARHTIKTDEKHDVLAVGTDTTEFPKHEAVVEMAIGKGRVVFCELKIMERVERGKPSFDPVAERVLLNLVKAGKGG